MNNRINRQLSFGYDIGKGFVVSEEEVAKIIDQLVLDPKIASDLKMRLDFIRLQVVRSLGKENLLLFSLTNKLFTSEEEYLLSKVIIEILHFNSSQIATLFQQGSIVFFWLSHIK